MAASVEYLEILDRMKDLHIRKAAGYSGDNPDTWVNFREAGNWGVDIIKGVGVRLGDKYKRLQNIVVNPANDRMDGSYPGVELEDVERTALDLAAYALIMAVLVRERRRVDETGDILNEAYLQNVFEGNPDE